MKSIHNKILRPHINNHLAAPSPTNKYPRGSTTMSLTTSPFTSKGLALRTSGLSPRQFYPRLHFNERPTNSPFTFKSLALKHFDVAATNPIVAAFHRQHFDAAATSSIVAAFTRQQFDAAATISIVAAFHRRHFGAATLQQSQPFNVNNSTLPLLL